MELLLVTWLELLLVTWLPLVQPAVSELPMPVNLTLNFSHLGFMLRWAPGPGTPPGTSYRVSLDTRRKHLPVESCMQVQQPLVCDLTGALDLTETYSTTVTAQLDTHFSKEAVIPEFRPISHLELPVLSVSPCDSDLCVHLHLRPGHQHFLDTYTNIQYQLQIRSNTRQFTKDIRSLNTVALPDLVPGTRYCISVRFNDDLVDKHSDFSQPVCAFTSGLFPTDAVISVGLCLVVMAALGVLAVLFSAGFICLRRKPLPSVLTSFRPSEESHLVASWTVSLPSLLKVWPITPSKRRKNSSQSSSEESDEEGSTESAGGNTGGAYEHQTHSLTSSSCLLVPSSTKPQTVAGLLLSEPPQSQTLTDVQSSAVPTNRPTAGSGGADNQEQMLQESSGNDVNLLTLTFGGQELPEALEHGQQGRHPLPDRGALGEDSGTPVLPSRTVTAGWGAEEEEEELDEDCGYMGR
ncbi:cytokine receptor family member b2 [Cololabis saira]|uniref:cytokine receptor family member b2 n=1 Tax=Cololabis saira TaxID=129043 RepID=UPI002AD4F2F5|nr:cytokine receptor family member b2 [Cololabis saira]XP_061579035.1 cytokine receptor family member b2 [Cololabis saira]